MAKDNLRSQTNITFVDLLCEGEIQGLVNGAKSIYINDTQLQNNSGTFNFDGVTFEERKGTNAQTALTLAKGVENEVTVNTQITKLTGAIVKTISDEDVDRVRVKLRMPALFQQADNGDVNGTTVQVKIEVQSDGGGYKPTAISAAYSTFGVTNVTSLHEQCSSFATRIKGKISLRGEFWYSYGGGFDEFGTPFPEFDVYYGFTYQIQYRAIGAASWITFETVNVGSLSGYWTDDFTIEKLVSNDYEVRINVTASGGGTPANVTGTLNCEFYQGIDTDTITGKASDGYERDYEIPLYGNAPWDIRVTRVTDDSTDLKIQNDTFWASYTEIVSQKFRYPNSALIGIRYDSSEFNSTPTRGYDVKLKKIRVPTNYDPISRRYIGVWNGTFQTVWSDNPAWCFYDLLTNRRYGLGNYIAEAQIDKWALYSIGQYCDAPVSNGDGGTEPRFTCNLYIQTREEAFKVLNDFASIFRSMIYWSNGTITFGQDAPKDPVALFSQSNVVGGQFNYSGSSAKTRHTVALVTWNDPEDFYRQKVEYVEDKVGIARYGVLEKEVTAIGCSSRGQASRVGKWLLYSDQYEGETISFSTGAEGLTIRPNDLIAIQDPTRGGARYSGRISSATTTAITIDSDFTLPSSSTMFVVLPNGTVQSKTISSKSGKVITLSSALTTAPQSGAIWMISAPSVNLQTFRVISASEGQDGTVGITGIKYDSAKYAYIEDGAKLPVRDYTNISIVPVAPTTITTSEALYRYQSQVRSKLIVRYNKGVNASEYKIEYRKDKNNWIKLINSDTDIEILNTTPGTYEIRVWSINFLNKQSATYRTITVNVLGKTAPPSNVTGLNIILNPVIGVTLDWADVTDLDLSTYEIRKGTTWASSTLVARVKASSYKLPSPPTVATRYLVKAVDTSNIYSTTAAEVILNFSAPSNPPSVSQFIVKTAKNSIELALDWIDVIPNSSQYETGGYEIRTSNTNWGSGTGFLYRGNASAARLKNISSTSNTTFYLRTYDINRNYASSSLTFVHDVTAPATMANCIVSVTRKLNRLYFTIKPKSGFSIPARPTDFDFYEFQVGKVGSPGIPSGTTDNFWDDADVTRISASTLTTVAIDLTISRFKTPLYSTAGVTYRVAVRMVDKSGNASPASALGSILVRSLK
jgi:predicted phage tail protein